MEDKTIKVIAGLINHNGRFLIAKRNLKKYLGGLWEFPGGKIDDNETPESAAIRETLEETGLKCQNLKPLLTYQTGMDIVSTPIFIFYSDEITKDIQEIN